MEISYKKFKQLFEQTLIPINKRFDSIDATLESHSLALDHLAKHAKDSDDTMELIKHDITLIRNNDITLIHSHLEKQDKAFSLIAKKIDLDLKPILK